MIMEGKVGIVMGMANRFSIAHGIGKSLKQNGATSVFTAQTDTFKAKIDDIALELGGMESVLCDVSKDGSICEAFEKISRNLGRPIDFVVHSIAYSDKNELSGKYYDTTRENFLNTMNISCYSLTEICRCIRPFMSDNGSIVTLSYYGSEKVVPNYNVMALAKSALETSVMYLAKDLGEYGIRVNSISSGPIKTLAASGIVDFSKILDYDANRSPLKRNVTQKDVADACVFLLSDMSSGITGENIHVDCGCSNIGVSF